MFIEEGLDREVTNLINNEKRNRFFVVSVADNNHEFDRQFATVDVADPKSLRDLILKLLRLTGRRIKEPRPDFFISYSHDTPRLPTMFSKREARGFGGNKWIDTDALHPGVTWSQDIELAIKNCRYFVFFANHKSLESSYCRTEFGMAHRHRRNIIIFGESIDVSEITGFIYKFGIEADWKIVRNKICLKKNIISIESFIGPNSLLFFEVPKKDMDAAKNDFYDIFEVIEEYSKAHYPWHYYRGYPQQDLHWSYL